MATTHIEGFETEIEAGERFAKTPVYAETSIPRGMSAHIGGGKFLTRCHECDEAVTHFGTLPVYRSIGQHERTAHDALVPGINVGMLPR